MGASESESSAPAPIFSLYSKESFSSNLCDYMGASSVYMYCASQNKKLSNISFYKQIRMYSTTKNSDSSVDYPNNELVFSNADKDKLEILNYVKGKSGIYMWTNTLNGKKYIGSSVNLRRRLLQYYNVNRLLNDKNMAINVALLKYGYNSFSFTVLEFCDLNSLMSKESYYFEVYKPEYNILKTPGSPSRGSGWKHSEATIEKMSIATKLLSQSSEYLTKLSLAQSTSIKVEVTDLETNTSTTYHAVRAAAKALGIDKRYIEHYIYLNQENPVLGRYTFKLLNLEDNKPLASVNQKTSIKIEVTLVKTQEVKVYPSVGAAARALGIRQSSISLYLKGNKTKPFKDLYIFNIV